MGGEGEGVALEERGFKKRCRRRMSGFGAIGAGKEEREVPTNYPLTVRSRRRE